MMYICCSYCLDFLICHIICHLSNRLSTESADELTIENIKEGGEKICSTIGDIKSVLGFREYFTKAGQKAGQCITCGGDYYCAKCWMWVWVPVEKGSVKEKKVLRERWYCKSNY